MVEMKTPGEVDAIRAAGRVVAGVLAAARAGAAPGVKLQDLDDAAREVLAKAGATSPFLHYKPKFAPVPYPAVICTSVNDAALHGIPGKYRLKATATCSASTPGLPWTAGWPTRRSHSASGRPLTATRS